MEKAKFKLVSSFEPMGDQPEAIDALCEGVLRGDKWGFAVAVCCRGAAPRRPAKNDVYIYYWFSKREYGLSTGRCGFVTQKHRAVVGAGPYKWSKADLPLTVAKISAII